MPDINPWATLVAALSAFMLGGLWYSPALFGKAWQREVGLSDDALAQAPMGRIFGGAFALSLLAAFVFALFLGPAPALPFALGAGAAAGFGWVAAGLGINYLFARRSLRLFAIDAGYLGLMFVLFGLVLGLWH